MNTKRNIFIIVLSMVTFCHTNIAEAQRNFYYRIDVGSSNIYSFAVSNLITGYANYFAHNFLFDNSYTYTFYSGRYMGDKTKIKPLDLMGISAEDLFNDCFSGVKLGYQSDNMGIFNWGIYGSAHYKINQFKAWFPFESDYRKECLQYFKPGVGILMTFGSIENKIKVQIEAAARYDIPISYNGVFGKNEDILNKGISSHFSIKVAGYTDYSIGIFADLNHYNLYKDFDDIGNSKFKMYNIGITFTISAKRGEDMYD